jgi:ubiquinone/menaquinone biosynthesis C-methylase UbiE
MHFDRDAAASELMGEPDLPATEAVRDYFSRDAEYWEAIYESSDDVAGHVYRERLERALRYIDEAELREGALATDVGAGAGLAAVALALRGFKVLAVDSTERMLDLTRERATRSGVDVEVCRADATALPVADESQDLVLALGLLPWVDDAPAVLGEFRRVLKPTGRLVVTADNRWRLNELLDPALSAPLAGVRRRVVTPILRALRRRKPASFEVQRHSQSELAQLLAAEGFVISDSSTVGFGPFTFMRRGVVNGARGRALSDWLERRARGSRFLARLGVHVVVMASVSHDPRNAR